MKVGIITTPNQKGQIVIPKEFRDALKIDETKTLHLIMKGGGFYVYPVAEVITAQEQEQSYAKVLVRTQGAWAAGQDTDGKKRKAAEIAASRKRKKMVW